MNKNAIKKFAIEARKKLIASVSDRAGMLGITPEGCGEPISKGIDFEVYKTVAGTEVTLDRTQCEQRRKLKEQIEARGFEAVVEEVAYTWFNRICAIRFMEVNDYLPTRVRVLSSEKEGKNEPDIVTQAPDVDLDFTDKEREYILDCKMNNKLDELFKMLFIKQCNKLSEILPELFEATEDYTEMLLNISFTNSDDVINMLVDPETGIPERDFNISLLDEDGEATGQVEIIGWLYQYYISERHEVVVNPIKKNAILKEDIPAATQLFTTDWVVRYMVDNSLGKLWLEGEKNSRIREKLRYFIDSNSDHDKESPHKISPLDIKVLDPCMGSGHILVYAFDVLMSIYLECGYSAADASVLIIKNNLFGIDIDKRAFQLAYFAIMMKGRFYNRRIFRDSTVIRPNVYAVFDSAEINCNHLKYFGFKMESESRNAAMEKISALIKDFRHGREYGSLIQCEEMDWKLLEKYVSQYDNYGQLTLENFGVDETNKKLTQLIEIGKVISAKYDIVVTNPPYMNRFENGFKEFLLENYSDYSSDLFSTFMYRNMLFCKQNGYASFMTPNVWMFLQSYEKLRTYILENKTITSLIQFAKGAFFSEATVDICAFILKNHMTNEKGAFYRLEAYKGNMDVQRDAFIKMLSKGMNCSERFDVSSALFSKLPASIIAYWVSDKIIDAFQNRPLGDVVAPRQGMAPSDTNRFLRMWFEVDFSKIGFGAVSNEDSISMKKKWYPYNKGGLFRKWYGNREYVVNWENGGYEVKEFARKLYKNDTRTIKNQQFYFKECISWSKISSGNAAFRYYEPGFVFSDAGMAVFSEDESLLRYIGAFLNSSVCRRLLEALSPTMNFEAGHIQRLPIIINDEYVNRISCIVDRCIELAKEDWDSFELSWDFKAHPFYTLYLQDKNKSLLQLYAEWEQICCRRFNEMKKLEETLENCFIELYGLSDEMSPVLSDKDNACRMADQVREVKSLLSYAVGCILGRYSLDKEGVVSLDTQDGNVSIGFHADLDNIVVITDEEYSADDIVGKVCSWLKDAFGEENYEQNLEFITSVIGGKGNTAQDVLRAYFLKEFYSDHLKIYQKRPIYWMLDAGKEDSFKCLMYIHRYTPDVVGIARIDYLHDIQKLIEQAYERAEYTRDNASGNSEKSFATRQMAKYTKQLAEIRSYDEAMAHLANQRIDLNLDDGVKVNYDKFQGIEVAQEGKKALKIDLLAKIK